MAIERRHDDLTQVLIHLCEVSHDDDLIEKCHSIVVDRKDNKGLYYLGWHYYRNKSYILMEKCFLMAIELGNVDCMYNLGYYYQVNCDYDKMEIHYLMAINRGHIKSLHQLAKYYQQIGKIDEMVNYYILAINKYNDKPAMEELSIQFNSNISHILKLIQHNTLINNKKGKYTRLVVKNIPLFARHFRFRDQSLTMKLLNYNFKLNNGILEEEVYQEIKQNDPKLLDYLTVNDRYQTKNRISQYINNWL